MPLDDRPNLGRRIREIRQARGKSLAVVAGLAGISKGHLANLELGHKPLDSRRLIAAIAGALDVSPSEITDHMVSAVGSLPHDAELPGVQRAVMAVNVGAPDGEVVPADILRQRIYDALAAQQDCRHVEVGHALPGLIGDIHATLDAHRDEREVLRLAVLLHLQGTAAWLWSTSSADLAWQAAMLAQQAAQRLDEPVPLALSAFGVAHSLLDAGALDLADRTLAVEPGTATREQTVATGMLALTSSLVAATRDEPSERTARLDFAAELAETMEPGPELWFGFQPANVAVWRMSCALEAGEHAEAARIAESVNPRQLPFAARQAAYYVNYGRALARLPKQQHKAVAALRRAEELSPSRVHRNPLARETISDLVGRAKRDAVGRDLMGLAYRSGLPV